MKLRRKIELASVFMGMVLIVNMIVGNVGEESLASDQSEQIDEPDYLNIQDFVVVKSEDGEMLLIPQEDVIETEEGELLFIPNEDMDKLTVESIKKPTTRSSTTPFMKNQDSEVIDRFSSFEEMRNYMENHTTGYNYNYNWDMRTSGSKVTEGTALGHSETNVQVTGVDEGDFVKTDGEYAYIVSRDGCRVFIADVNLPENAYIVSTINAKGTISEIYLKDSILVVVGQRAVYQIDPQPVLIDSNNELFIYNGMEIKLDVGKYYYLNYLYYQATFIDIFDISDRKEPDLLSSHVIKGIPQETRMIEDYLYVITSHNVYGNIQEYDLPVPASEIYYLNLLSDIDSNNWYLQLTTIMSIDITRPSEIVDMRVLLMSASDDIYVSQNNIYITYCDFDYVNDIGITSLHRITIENGEILYGAHRKIDGRLLDRYSMDEYEDYFRVAVSTGWSTSHNVYILDMDMNIVGRLEGIAPNERLCSARFTKDRLYLVTFMRVDPFFTIDLSDPANPTLLGELVIPGWSDYLHPYDENHVIGLGREVAANGRREGVKLSLFNVTDIENPKEISKFVIGDSSTWTIAAQEPHAFLFSKEKNLIVIPVRINYTESSAYIINISMEHGFELRGNVSHPKNEYDPMDYNWYLTRAHYIKRSFYIDDTLFTLSSSFLQMDNLNDLNHINRIRLPNEPQRSWENQFICIYFEPIMP
jgi:uncharacterized secreted protein with C-terminal beta-propeller domain